ncbi:MAG TPA: FHA domain-containing protein [Desulfobacterales bacterium]|nr:FHA domain-containing protein [Desulfobacterales bacterium]
MTKELLRTGIALAKAGKGLEARSILGQVVKDDPRSAIGWLWLAGVVETQEQQRYCLKRVLQLDPQNKMARQALTQIKLEDASKKVAKPHTDLGQPGNVEDFRRVVASVFSPLGCEFYYAGKSADKGIEEGEPLLLDICQAVFSTDFGIFDLSSGNLNAYLELGIALGLNRPVIVTVGERVSLPPLLRERDVITYADHSDLEAKLSRLCEQDFPPTTEYAPDYCYFCGRVCESMSTPPDENSYLALNRSKLLWRDLMQSLTPHLASYHLYPDYLTDRASGPRLCDVRRKVLSAQFVLCHLGTLSDESGFLSLGMAIGSRVPWVLLSKKGRDSIPSDLQGVDRIEYATFADLEGPLTNTLGTFLGRIRSGAAVKGDKTALLSLPFWVQLEDWITHVARPAEAHREIQGKIQVVQYKGQKCLAKHIIPGRGLLFGRSDECDVVVENSSVSSRHFRMLKGRAGKCFVEDLHSKNGTFLNGTRLSPGQRVAINIEDTIRIPGARFLIWDDRPLPKEEAVHYLDTTGLLPPIRRIEIPDVSPPTYLSTWDHPMVLTVLLPDGYNRSMFEVQAYYPLGRILAELVNLLDLSEREYCFEIEGKNQPIDDNETPLSTGIKSGDVLMMVLKG